MYCVSCNTIKSEKWYSGPTCRRCYRNKRDSAIRDKLNAQRKAYMVANPHKKKEYEKRHQEVNRESYLASQKRREARHRAIKLNATPKWADREAIDKIYNECPAGYHVDHVLPLKGKEVCGLHVSWNLQYLLPADNIAKSNKLT